MKSTGIVRKVDELGRIVLPIEMRRRRISAYSDALEIYVSAFVRHSEKYKPSCVSRRQQRHQWYSRGSNIPQVPVIERAVSAL